jgi:hypothetical protein
MTKPKANSILDALPPNQRETLVRWLFEENLGYAAAAQRLWQDFSVRCSPTAVANFYQRQAGQQMLDRIAASRSNANLVVEKLMQNPADTMAAMLGMIGQIAFDKAFQSGKDLDVETIAEFAKLALLGRKQEMDAASLQLQRDKFQFDAAKAALAQLPALRKIASDKSLDETGKLEQVRLKLFGVLPS